MSVCAGLFGAKMRESSQNERQLRGMLCYIQPGIAAQAVPPGLLTSQGSSLKKAYLSSTFELGMEEATVSSP